LIKLYTKTVSSLSKYFTNYLNKKTLKKIVLNSFSILNKKEKRVFKLLIFFNFLISLTDIAVLTILLSIVSLYTDSNNQLVSLLPSIFRNAESLFPIIALVVIFILKNTVGYLIFQKQSTFFFAIASRISRQKLVSYLNSSYEQYILSDRAKIFNSVNYRPIEFAQNILSSIQTIFTESTIILITIIAILIFKPILFILLIIFLLPPILIAASLVRKKMNYIKHNILQDSERVNQYMNETFSGFIESNVSGKENFFTNRHSFFQKKLGSHLSQLQIAQWIPNRIVEIFAVLGLFLLILLNKLGGIGANLLDIGAFLAAAYKIMPGISRIANANALIKTYEQVLNDLKQSEDEAMQNSSISKTEKIQTIRFDNVYFEYKTNSVLKDLNIEITSGDFVAVSGPSGRGKTTFINLLLGLLKPNKGSIWYNEQLVTQNEIKNYYPSLTYVKQQALLIQDTIETNITLSDEKIDFKRLEYAITFSGLIPLINSYPDGIKSIIADEGKNLSGGQKQRIAIARALYKDADLLIFDEPFNELDNDSELQLLQQLRALCDSGKIVILISHNTMCLDYCNKQIKID
jgi:ABC-type multidrug transport system fused ATPase/permease subunit